MCLRTGAAQLHRERKGARSPQDSGPATTTIARSRDQRLRLIGPAKEPQQIPVRYHTHLYASGRVWDQERLSLIQPARFPHVARIRLAVVVDAAPDSCELYGKMLIDVVQEIVCSIGPAAPGSP